MTPIAQRIAIAKHRGFKPDGPADKPEGIIGWRLHGVYWSVLPDYLGSLDAMHEVEKVLTSGQREAYSEMLCEDGETLELAWMNATKEVMATAAERAEAFLKTIGRWEGS